MHEKFYDGSQCRNPFSGDISVLGMNAQGKGSNWDLFPNQYLLSTERET